MGTSGGGGGSMGHRNAETHQKHTVTGGLHTHIVVLSTWAVVVCPAQTVSDGLNTAEVVVRGTIDIVYRRVRQDCV